MPKLNKFIFVAGLISMLSGCQDQYDYQYLVTHPDVMRKKMQACQSASKMASTLDKQQCQIVISASTKFMSIVAEQETDAEKFGVRILAAQSDYAVLQAKVVQMKSDLAKVTSAGSVDVAAVHKLEAELAITEKQCEDKRQEVKLLLAVVGVGTPG